MMLLEYDPKLLTVSQHSMLLVSSLTNRFLKFLTRFSGRRRVFERHNFQQSTFKSPKYYGHSHYFRNCKFNIVTTIVLWLLLSTIGVTAQLVWLCIDNLMQFNLLSYIDRLPPQK
ncbi:hypothetical protein PVAND_002564 [Polypedilum vanderplanki]|uniref:Uncharacterized protein n=1 Tax=Polypedilum vanderplanki TaxID=319348 RepID=A0A9J6BRD6_POLVA|nr:hypothetical protein PVAND_002564 [Polypedilum vanderplanki]